MTTYRWAECYYRNDLQLKELFDDITIIITYYLTNIISSTQKRIYGYDPNQSSSHTEQSVH